MTTPRLPPRRGKALGLARAYGMGAERYERITKVLAKDRYLLALWDEFDRAWAQEGAARSRYADLVHERDYDRRLDRALPSCRVAIAECRDHVKALAKRIRIAEMVLAGWSHEAALLEWRRLTALDHAPVSFEPYGSKREAWEVLREPVRTGTHSAEQYRQALEVVEAGR